VAIRLDLIYPQWLSTNRRRAVPKLMHGDGEASFVCAASYQVSDGSSGACIGGMDHQTSAQVRLQLCRGMVAGFGPVSSFGGPTDPLAKLAMEKQ